MKNAVLERPNTPANLQLLTKAEAARLLACSVRMIERLVAAGTLAKVQIRGAVRFRLSDIERLIEKGKA